MNNNKQELAFLQEKDATCYQQELIKEIEKMAYVERASLNYTIAKSNDSDRLTVDQSKIAKVIGASRWSANVAMGKLHDKGLVHKTYRYKLPCHYTVNPIFKREDIRKLLQHLLPALWKAPLFLLVSVMVARSQIKLQFGYPTLNVINSLSFERTTRESTEPKLGTHGVLTNHLPEVHKDHEGTEHNIGTNGEEGLRSSSPFDLEFWDFAIGSTRVQPEKERYYQEQLKKQDEENKTLMKSIKEAMMVNPIKGSVMEVTGLLNLNQVGQIRLMQYNDATLKYAALKFKENKTKKDRPFEYFMGIANNYTKKNNIEVDQKIVSFLLDTYGLNLDMKPTGLMHGIDVFKGEPAKSPIASHTSVPEKGRERINQQSSSHRSAQEQHSATDFRIHKVDELTEARDFLEQCTYNPNTTLMPMPNHLKELLAKGKQLANEGKISIRPKSIWIEAIKPNPAEFSSKDIYTARLRSWMELKAKVIDNKTIVTFIDEGEVHSRIIEKEQPKETLSNRVSDIGSLLGSLFKQGSTPIIKEVLNPGDVMSQKKKDLSSQVNCIVIPSEFSKIPTAEECIPVVSHQMLDDMNLKPERITPDLSNLDGSETIDEYVGRIAGCFDLDEVYD